MAVAISDAGRIPRWYSLAVGLICCSPVISFVVGGQGDAVSRATIGAVLAVLAVGYFWVSRKIFRSALAKPLPRRGLGRWLVSRPGWLMVLANLACWLIPLGLVEFVFLVRPALGNWHGLLLRVGPIVVICALGQAAGWLELRRMQS